MRKKLRLEFSSLLSRTGTFRAYQNLGLAYVISGKNYEVLSKAEAESKLDKLIEGDPRKWITELFTEIEGIPPQLAKVNDVWLKHLDDIGWD